MPPTTDKYLQIFSGEVLISPDLAVDGVEEEKQQDTDLSSEELAGGHVSRNLTTGCMSGKLCAPK